MYVHVHTYNTSRYIVRASPSFLLHESINRSYHTFHQVMSPESMEHASLPPSMEAGTPRVAYCGAWSLASEFSMSFFVIYLVGYCIRHIQKKSRATSPPRVCLEPTFSVRNRTGSGLLITLHRILEEGKMYLQSQYRALICI